jgi:hypothetical protein
MEIGSIKPSYRLQSSKVFWKITSIPMSVELFCAEPGIDGFVYSFEDKHSKPDTALFRDTSSVSASSMSHTCL